MSLFSITDENTGKHHIYPITEVEILNYKKGSNLVCSLLYWFLFDIIGSIKPDKIVLFADNCAG